jgi:hypothetical protein
MIMLAWFIISLVLRPALVFFSSKPNLGYNCGRLQNYNQCSGGVVTWEAAAGKIEGNLVLGEYQECIAGTIIIVLTP